MRTTNAIPVRGLIIRPEPLQKILSGTKTMELRSRLNQQRGVIALIQKSSGHIFGVAEIGESVGPMSFEDFASASNEHGVEAHRLREVFESGYTTGWKLRKVRRLKSPVPYLHKPGAVIWATLDANAIAGLAAELAAAL